MNVSHKLNLEFGVVDNAHIMRNVNLGFNAAETLSLICHELGVDDFDDFDSAAIVLDDFCSAAKDETGYTVSVWID